MEITGAAIPRGNAKGMSASSLVDVILWQDSSCGHQNQHQVFKKLANHYIIIPITIFSSEPKRHQQSD